MPSPPAEKAGNGKPVQVETRAPAPRQAPSPSSNNFTTTSTRGVRAQRRRSGHEQRTRLFVLDTNVLMHDPTSFVRFAEHDVFLPIMKLEELDNHKERRFGGCT